MTALTGSANGAQHRRRRSLLLGAGATVLALIVWTLVLGAGVLFGWWHSPIAPHGDTRAFFSSARDIIERERVGNVAFALIERGHILETHFASIRGPVDANTLFQVASLSKLAAAWGVMSLVESGKIDLDLPVSNYLSRWRLPNSEHDVTGVTVRRLLSHTAGLTDGLGYAGFPPGAPIQTLEASLTHAADASPGADGRTQVGAEPGDAFLYSGGGYALLQLIVEEVSGEPFDGYMRRAVFEPLGMTGSGFVLSDAQHQRLAEFFDTNGNLANHYRFAALAPVSLYTSVADLALLLGAYVPGPQGEPTGRGVLRPETLDAMRRPHAYQYGAAIWGLGTILFASNNAGTFIIGHDGSNAPATNTAARVDPASGDGIVILETGNLRLATDIAGEWVYWRTGNIDTFTFMVDAQRVFPIMAGGWALIVVTALALVWRNVKR